MNYTNNNDQNVKDQNTDNQNKLSKDDHYRLRADAKQMVKNQQKIENLSIDYQLLWLWKIYHWFVRKSKIRELKKECYENNYKYYDKEKWHYFLRLEKFEDKFRLFIDIFSDIVISKKSIKAYFKQFVECDHKMSRATFYSFKSSVFDLINRYVYKDKIDLEKYLNKLPIKENQKFTYTIEDRKLIFEKYNESIKNGFDFEITNFWLHVRNDDKNKQFHKISSITVKKILIENNVEFSKSKRKYIAKHPKRRWLVEPGIFQLDLKIIGRLDTCIGVPIVVFDMIDVRSRLVYSRAIKNQNTETMIKTIEKGLKFFKSKGIEVKSVQTDNAMLFKGTNFVKSGDFANFLKERNIKQRFIKLGVPQQNGCVERYHRTIDLTCKTRLSNAKTFRDVASIIKELMKHYNEKRYHYYSELEGKCPYSQRFMFPVDAISKLGELFNASANATAN